MCRRGKKSRKQLDKNTINIKEAVSKTNIKYGFIDMYPGVPISNNTYSSPILAVHLYRQAHYDFNIAKDKRTVVVNDRHKPKAYRGDQSLRQRGKVDVDMELIMIPVEDILHISATAAVKKGLEVDDTIKRTSVYQSSETCWDRCFGKKHEPRSNSPKSSCCCCCRKKVKIADEHTCTALSVIDPNRETEISEVHIPVPKKKECWCTRCINYFRCWCCRRKRIVEYIQKRRIDKETEAERVITITIEYSKYSHPDSLSNARLLSTEDQNDFYKKKFDPNKTLVFYLLNDTEYDSNNFAMKMKQTTDLCRTVMQMKGVKDQYPSNDEFFHILENFEKRTIGKEYLEPELTYTTDPTGIDRHGRGYRIELTTFEQRRVMANERF